MEDPFPYVRERFPRWRVDIVRFSREDGDFEEMCLDYEEVVAFLLHLTRDPTTVVETTSPYRCLLEELEAEILEYLQTRDKPVEPQPAVR